MYDIENPIADDNFAFLSLAVGLTSDELIQQFSELNILLLSAGFRDQVEGAELMSVAIEADEFDSSEIVVELDNLLREASRVCLLECGVQYDEDISMEMLTDLVRNILHFNATEDPQSLLDAINAADDEHDALLRVLEYLSGRGYDEWLTVVTDVADGVIDRVELLALAALDTVNVTQDTDYEFAKRLEVLKSVDSSELVESFEHLSTPPNIDSLYLVNVDKLLDQGPEDVVKSLYAIASVTQPSLESAYHAVGILLDDFCDSAINRHEHEQYRRQLKSTYSNLFGE